MPETIFSGQLDYIFFVYGLAFIVLGVVCLIRHQSGQGTVPWLFMGLFGITHGLNEWLDLLSMVLGDTPLFSATRLVLLAVSFAFLVEFGRVGTINLGIRTTGRWTVPILLLGGVLIGSLMGGPNGLNAGFRYSLGLVGSLWAAFAIFTHAGRLQNVQRAWLISAAIAMALYGLASGAVVPTASLFPANILNHENFFAATGMPIQLFRAFFACWLLWSIWIYDLNCYEESHSTKKRRWYFYGFLALLVMIISLGWVLSDKLGRLNLEDMRHNLRSETTLLSQRLQTDISTAQGLAIAMSTSKDISAMPDTTSGTLNQINHTADRFARIHLGLIAYVMDRSGTVVSASNRNLPTSFVGKNYAFRPYFKEALAGRFGEYFAIGVTTNEAGYYASAPVYNNRQEITGVAVVKRTLNAESLGLTQFLNAYMIDSNGIVLLSGIKDTPYSLWPLQADKLEQIQTTRQFANKDYSSLAQQILEDGDWVSIVGKKFLVGRKTINNKGWSIVLLQQEKSSLVNRSFGILLTLMVSLLVVGAALALQREIGVEMELHRNQQRLEDLSKELERLATTDKLTGAVNRLKFDEILSREINIALRYQRPLSIIMYDIDHFKLINDTYGHQAGDAVLVQMTQLVANSIRESDVLARWGGEEFIIIAPQSNSSDAAKLAGKLRALIEAEAFTGVSKQSCSFGVAQIQPDDTADTLTARVDQALYQAKTSGRNRVVAI